MSSGDSSSLDARRAASRRTRQSSEGALVTSADTGARAQREEVKRDSDARLVRDYEGRAYTLLLDLATRLLAQNTQMRFVLGYYAHKGNWSPQVFADPEDPQELAFSTGDTIFLPNNGETDGYIAAQFALLKCPEGDDDERILADIRRMIRRVEVVRKRRERNVDGGTPLGDA